MSSSTGNLFRLTTFGESHGLAIGGIIDGCPSGLKLDFKHIQKYLSYRRPGLSDVSSERLELDQVEFLSGVFEGVTLGTPIGFLIKNINAKSKDYNELKDLFRPSHADFAYEKKYGLRDYRGGGRSSARETANWVVGGAIALQILKTKNIFINSYVSSVGEISVDVDVKNTDLKLVYKNNVRCPIEKTAKKMEQLIKKCKIDGDTVGGQISTVVDGLPAGLGEPVFHKLQSAIAQSVMNINACKGVEFGLGFEYSKKRGSQANDSFILDQKNKIQTKTNNAGGILGGISNGQNLYFRTAFKPVSTIFKKQKTITKSLQQLSYIPSGRHDPCVVPRAVPIVDSLTAMIILDYYLLNKTTKISDL
tara:strand:+ start:1138 stop:2226 length:1089 start_codon:yes stop_codon:yes gene_type:complete